MNFWSNIIEIELLHDLNFIRIHILRKFVSLNNTKVI
jgi:hypothetical protein